MKILNTKDQKTTFIKCLIGGVSGSGKTTLAGTLDTKTLMISGESRTLVLKDKDIDYLNINWSDEFDKEGNPVVLTNPAARLKRLEEVYKYLYAGCPGQDGRATWKYKNVFIDSLTELSELLVQKLNNDFPERKDALPMWGEYTKQMQALVKNFRDLPYHIFMVSISSVEKDNNNKRYVGFDISGKISDRLPQYFDEVFHLHVNADGERTLVTRANDTLIHCKDCSKKLDAQEPADLGKIARKILVLEGDKK